MPGPRRSLRPLLAYVVVAGAVAAAWLALDDARWTVPAVVVLVVASLVWGAWSGLLAPVGPVVVLAVWVAMVLLVFSDASERDVGIWLLGFAFVGAEVCAVVGALVGVYVALGPERSGGR
jgi:hypothetical protein